MSGCCKQATVVPKKLGNFFTASGTIIVLNMVQMLTALREGVHDKFVMMKPNRPYGLHFLTYNIHGEAKSTRLGNRMKYNQNS